MLGSIEAAWRAKHKSLRGLVYKGDDEREDLEARKLQAIIPESTWHSWRKGETTPDYLELRRVAREVGLDVGPVIKDAPVGKNGGTHLKPETAEVVKWMEGLSEEARRAVMDAAHAKILELASRPPEAVAESEGASRSRKSS